MMITQNSTLEGLKCFAMKSNYDQAEILMLVISDD